MAGVVAAIVGTAVVVTAGMVIAVVVTTGMVTAVVVTTGMVTAVVTTAIVLTAVVLIVRRAALEPQVLQMHRTEPSPGIGEYIRPGRPVGQPCGDRFSRLGEQLDETVLGQPEPFPAVQRYVFTAQDVTAPPGFPATAAIVVLLIADGYGAGGPLGQS
ncbi:hypothetical protein [Micromonospora luteifusca]|uniref:hypothetical protein n=1 Tax=Micromonospora luteifusca TaxID=709860 RepID=UPI0033A22614